MYLVTLAINRLLEYSTNGECRPNAILACYNTFILRLSNVTDSSHPWRREIRHYSRIAWPLVLNNLAMAGMQFADTVMAGQLGAEALAIVAVGSAVWFFSYCFSMGLLMALSAFIAHSFGAKNDVAIGAYARQGVTIALLMAFLVLMFAQFGVARFFAAIGIDANIHRGAVDYVQAISMGAPLMFLFLVMRYITEGIGVTRPIMIATVFQLLCNVVLNYCFIFGHFGAPAMGAVGAGVASAITMNLTALGMFVYLRRHPRYQEYQLWRGEWWPNRALQRQLWGLGLPMAIGISAEVGLFNAIALLMGSLGATAAAANQIAINFASTTFMIPMAIGAAATVRVGHLLGANRPEDGRYAAWFAVWLCVGIMALSALCLLFYRDVLVTWYTPVASVGAIAIDMLAIAAVFQVVDGLQVGVAGALRAYKDTRVPMVICIFSYWVCAFPTAYVFVKVLQWPPSSVWWGFVIGLGVAGVLLSQRLRVISSRYTRVSPGLPLA